MTLPILTTKLYTPPSRPDVVLRPRLIDRLNAGLHRKLTLISAPAGFGKTTLVSDWIAESDRPTAWLSLDDGDNDPIRYLTYVVTALRAVAPTLGDGILSILQSPQPPPIESILTMLLNEIATITDEFVLVLDDYHLIDDQQIDDALTFLLDYLPSPVHLVITTREDPSIPLARYRVRGQLTELRAADLRFTTEETAGFLNQMMGLNLSTNDIHALEARTEGWIAGLQLAALSMQGHHDTSHFIESFTGSHRFVLDYLVEEVLQRQPDSIQHFLLQTSVLDRLCGSLCDAIMQTPDGFGQEMLAYIEQANLFLVPLDNERRWYRYHHLFGDLLQQRLSQHVNTTADSIAALHIRASQWYEDNNLEIEAFQHATAANDIDRAARLLQGDKMPIYFRGGVNIAVNWFASLPTSELDARPALWVMYASALTLVGLETDTIGDKLRAAEAALQDVEPDEKYDDLIGHIATIRAMIAAPHYDIPNMFAQAQRALEFLAPDNYAVRTMATWILGLAYQFQGERAAAKRLYTEAIAISPLSGNSIVTMAGATCLGQIEEGENKLYLAEEHYRHVIEVAGDPPWATACEGFLGLARLCYQWNDLEAAQQHTQVALQLAQQIENIDTPIECQLLLALLKWVAGDVRGAFDLLAKAEQQVYQRNFMQRLPEVINAQVFILIQQGNLEAAAELADTHDLPESRARIFIQQDDPDDALEILDDLYHNATEKALLDEQLKIRVLQALAYDAAGNRDAAITMLKDALMMAEAGGFIRIFVDEGEPMAALLTHMAKIRFMPEYVNTLLVAFNIEGSIQTNITPMSQALIEPLSDRELEILQLVADGLSNREISERLYLALSTIKGHNRNIYGKLGVQRRTEAIARARELGLL